MNPSLDNHLFEAFAGVMNESISANDVNKASTIILSYLKKNGFPNAVKMPGSEEFKNSIEHGIGIRYFYDRVKSVRLNWAVGGSSAYVTSADLWVKDDGNDAADIHIAFDKNMSLVRALPAVVGVMKNPLIGPSYVFENAGGRLEEAVESVFLNESIVNIPRDVAVKFVDHLTDGGKVSDITKVFGGPGYRILDKLKQLYPNNFEKQGVAFVFRGDKKSIDVDRVLSAAGGSHVVVTKGPSSETRVETKTEKDIETNGERLAFEEQIKDMKSVLQMVIKGAAYSMFIAGAGGVGKTHTTEEVLNAAGLRDGEGYFKITGSASPIGIYSALFKNKDGIVLFDDCDSALDQQEGRNLIKAATDTKKIRKLVWMKKGGSNFYNPDIDEEPEDDEDMLPTYFQFTGKVIFISNLPLTKLDPDGALRTRSFVVNIDPTQLEIVEFMSKVVDKVPLDDGLSLSHSERMEVIGALHKMVGKRNLSLRNMVRGLNIRASGIPNWEDILVRYG
jgi:hypothetical protein